MLRKGLFLGDTKCQLTHELTNTGYSSKRWLANDLNTNEDVLVCVFQTQERHGILECFLKKTAGDGDSFVFIQHPRIQNSVLFINGDNNFFVVVPFYQGSIYSLYKSNNTKLTESQCWKILYDVSSGLSFLHNLEPVFVYGNLSPRCILLKENGDYIIDMTDYYFSGIYPKNDLERGYLSPECRSVSHSIEPSDDIWSLGAIVYELITGNHLEVWDEQAKNILESNCSKELSETMGRCLSADCNQRYSAHELENISFFHANSKNAHDDFESIAHDDTLCWNCGGHSTHNLRCCFVIKADENMHKLLYNVYIPKCDECEKEDARKKRWNLATGIVYYVVTTTTFCLLLSGHSYWVLALVALLNAGVAALLGFKCGGIVRKLLAGKSIRKFLRKDEDHPMIKMAIETGFNGSYVEMR